MNNLGSARAWRAGDGALAIANFFPITITSMSTIKIRRKSQ
jgi:hypothetical protein